jgi:DNA repair protein RadC
MGIDLAHPGIVRLWLRQPEMPAIEAKQHHTIRITDLPQSERPRERLIRVGERALSTTELLAITLKSGAPGENALQLAERLLVQFDGTEGLAQATAEELRQIRGIGLDKAARILATMALWRRLATTPQAVKTAVRSPAEAANLFMPQMRELAEEQLQVLLLNTRNDVLNIETVSTAGWLEPEHVVKTVFAPAIRHNAAALILAHNHVNGEGVDPSADDLIITEHIVEAGKLFSIDVLDHLIVHENHFISLRECGVRFGSW